MPKLIYDSDSDSGDNGGDNAPRAAAVATPLGSHDPLGGGKVADLLMWKNKNLSAGVLAGATFLWFLFEVVEYNLLTLICHLCIIAMLLVFIWSNATALIDWVPPKFSEIIISDRALREAAMSFHGIFTKCLRTLYDIACGEDLKLFLLTIASFWVISVIGSYCSSATIIYLGFLCAQTLPNLYKRYENEVDHLAKKGRHDLKKIYQKVDSKVLNKIPRGPVKNHKFR